MSPNPLGSNPASEGRPGASPRPPSAPSVPPPAQRRLDAAEILKTLGLFYEPSQVFEVRVLSAVPKSGWHKPRTFIGYFRLDEVQKLVRELERFELWSGVYVTLNPINDSLYARSAGRLQDSISAAGDADVTSRRLLLIDFDPYRPAGISSTKVEHEQAIELAREARKFLCEEMECPAPILASSGNGAHLIFRVQLSADDVLVKRVLQAIHAKFSNERVGVDTVVHNASRISKLYGTLACKGDSVPDRPHRMARIIEAPPTLEVVPREKLEELVCHAGASGQPESVTTLPRTPGVPAASPNGQVTKLDMDEVRRLIHALDSIPADGRSIWLRVGMALHGLGSTLARTIWDCWSKRCTEKYDESEQEKAWRSFDRGSPHAVKLGTVFHLAKENGWDPSATKPHTADDLLAAVARSDIAAADLVLEDCQSSAPQQSEHRAQPEAPLAPYSPSPPPPHEVLRVPILLSPGMLASNVDEAVDKLNAAEQHKGRGRSVFGKGGALVHVVESDNGSVRTPILTPHGLRDTLSRIIGFVKLDERGNRKPLDFPMDHSKAFLDRGEWPFPELRGVSGTPVIDADGRIASSRGFDQSTGILIDIPTPEWPVPILEEPNLDEAKKALSTLEEALCEFPWCNPHDRAVVYAAAITVVCRNLFDQAPLFGITATTRGSGKSLLAEVLSILGTGRPARMLQLAEKEEEMDKSVHALLLESNSFVCIDNVDRPLRSSTLCTALTQPVYSRRVLGFTMTAHAPTTATTWVATGNNLTFEGDITRRVLMCELDAQLERPEERVFKRELIPWVKENRPYLVSAILTIMRAYILAGMPTPDGGLSRFGSFESWSRFVRGALVWLGVPDPCLGRERLMGNDPEREDLDRLLDQLHIVFPAARFTAKDVVAASSNNRDLAYLLYDLLGPTARESARSVGKYLVKQAARIVEGRRLVEDGKQSGAKLWIVEQCGGSNQDAPNLPSEGEFGEFEDPVEVQTHFPKTARRTS